MNSRRQDAATLSGVTAFDLPGALRRIRRLADLSQRELADACAIPQSAVAQAESGRRGLPVAVLVRAAAVAGLRIALLDENDAEVAGMDGEAVRDMSGRRFPAHLDTRYGDEAWWHGTDRYSRKQPWYTFDRERYTRNWYRAKDGTPDDHQLPQPGDSPEERTAARKQAWREQRAERTRRLRLAGLLPEPEVWDCTCPPPCDNLDETTGAVLHVPDCTCLCDLS